MQQDALPILVCVDGRWLLLVEQGILINLDNADYELLDENIAQELEMCCTERILATEAEQILTEKYRRGIIA